MRQSRGGMAGSLECQRCLTIRGSRAAPVFRPVRTSVMRRSRASSSRWPIHVRFGSTSRPVHSNRNPNVLDSVRRRHDISVCESRLLASWITCLRPTRSLKPLPSYRRQRRVKRARLDMTFNDAFVKFLTDELLPWVQQEYTFQGRPLPHCHWRRQPCSADWPARMPHCAGRT